MHQSVRDPRGFAALVLSLCVAAWLLPQNASAQDPAQNVGPGECAECHESEVEVWKETAHYAHARTLTRSPKAREIAKALGVKRVKASERCTSCHFTVTKAEGRRPKTQGGVSCESCHGGARDWIDIHGNYGSAGATRASESPTHRKQRLAAANGAGMHRAADLYDLASGCFGCHVIDDEELVRAGHPVAGGTDFIAYTQGAMRHNFVRGQRGENAESSPERRGQMHVISQSAELVHALRALSDAGAGSYADHQVAQVRRALKELEKASGRAPAKELREIVEVVRALRIDASAGAAASKAAKQVEARGRALAQPSRESEFGGVAPAKRARK
jgi:hypothetical protein